MQKAVPKAFVVDGIEGVGLHPHFVNNLEAVTKWNEFSEYFLNFQ